MFRKINAKDDIFQQTKSIFNRLYEDFKTFCELETINSGMAKDGKSGKASSYANYIIRLIIFYREKHPNEYLTFFTMDDYLKLKSVNSREFQV